MIAYVLLWMIPPVLLLLAVAVWLVLRVLKAQSEIRALVAHVDQSAVIKGMRADLSNVMGLVAQDVRLAGIYKDERDDALALVAELEARVQAAEAEAALEKNRRIGAVRKMERTR